MSITRGALVALAALAGLSAPALAHRLDEYLHATTINLERDQITLHLRLTPGMEVAQGVIHQIDRNKDGHLSPAEQQAYVARFLHGLSLSLNGQEAHLVLEAAHFPTPAVLRSGAGVIDLQFGLKTSLGDGNYHLVYRNQGSGPQTVWLVNGLQPLDRAIQMIAQRRSEDQSSYVLDFSVHAE